MRTGSNYTEENKSKIKQSFNSKSFILLVSLVINQNQNKNPSMAFFSCLNVLIQGCVFVCVNKTLDIY